MLVILCGGCGGGHKVSYVAQNNAILRALPTYPGSKLTTSYSVVVPKNGNTPRHAMYTTTHQLLLPDGTRCATVLRWYGDRFARRGWRLREHDLEFEVYVRGPENASVGCLTDETSSGATHHEIDLVVNAHRR